MPLNHLMAYISMLCAGVVGSIKLLVNESHKPLSNKV